MKKIGAFFIGLTLLFSFVSCSPEIKRKYSAEYLVFFDTLTQVISYTESKEEFDRFSTLVHDELKEYHQLYNIYDDFKGINNIKTINENAGKAPVRVDKKIIDLLLFSKEAYTRTNGKCNIALGAVLRIWHDYREAGSESPEKAALPPVEQLQKASRHTDINKILIDEAASTVYLSDPDMSLDVGAVAKGYATEQIAALVEKNGITSGLLNVGGNVRAIGSKDGKGKPWTVSIRNPDKEEDDTPLLTTEVADKSVVTSGYYERFYTVNGKKYHHIIDPDTLMPADYFKSVTILCQDSGIADELSTALFCMPFEDGLKLVEGLPDTEVLWVAMDGTEKYSSGFKNYIKK